jgi:hypothetical protein
MPVVAYDERSATFIWAGTGAGGLIGWRRSIVVGAGRAGALEREQEAL